MLKRVVKQIEVIKSSRSGTMNFESHKIEANDLQSVDDEQATFYPPKLVKSFIKQFKHPILLLFSTYVHHLNIKTRKHATSSESAPLLMPLAPLSFFIT